MHQHIEDNKIVNWTIHNYKKVKKDYCGLDEDTNVNG